MGTLTKYYSLRNPEQDIQKYIEALSKEAETNIWFKKSSSNLVYLALLQANSEGRIRAWYDQDNKLIGLILYDISYVWWTYSKVLQEETVFCLDPTFKGFQRIAMAELEEIARSNACDFICAGNMVTTKDKAKLVANGYKRHGKYDHEYSLFVKEIDYDE